MNNITVAVAGNPNVGKSTLFNALTGMHQHTGNWAGKTVGNAVGEFLYDGEKISLVDIPGTYSLLSLSKEEEIARDFLLFGNADKVLVVCDATTLERNLNLCLQIMEIHPNVSVCVNLMDEAKKKGISIDLKVLSRLLSAETVGTVARNGKTLESVKKMLSSEQRESEFYKIPYPKVLEEAIEMILPALRGRIYSRVNLRWLSIKLLTEQALCQRLSEFYEINLCSDEINSSVKKAEEFLSSQGILKEDLQDMVVTATLKEAEKISDAAVKQRSEYSNFDLKLDKFFTGKKTAVFSMLVLLLLTLWITVSGANYISEALSIGFGYLEKGIEKLLDLCRVGEGIQYVILEGIFRVPFWVISVMLPPMAIFFPLFTFLEDLGYLPRVAFNLDKPFMRCKSCGKQSLTMCMGLGCNAVGVTGCRIIDSPRERLLGILTNSFMPCNGRFPTIIAVISAFLVTVGGFWGGLLSSVTLTAVLVMGIFMTLFATKLLSSTVLKGYPSAYILEMPHFRKPQIGKILVRSVLDRTVFVLGRAITAAVPAGIVIFLMANITVGGDTLLNHTAEFLDPLGNLMGLDGMIILAFVLGFPANEIVVPIILMGYMSAGNLTQMPDISQMRDILIANGWTVNTAISMILFTLFHWPCATTVLTVKKETKSLAWTMLSVLLPTVIGMVLCFAVTFLMGIV